MLLELLNKGSEHVHAETEPVKNDDIGQLIFTNIVSNIFLPEVYLFEFLLIKYKILFCDIFIILLIHSWEWFTK